MKKLMSKIKKVLSAWCLVLGMGLALGAQAATETVSYLEPVIGSNGAVSGYTTKTATCTVLESFYGDDLTLSAGWYVTCPNQLALLSPGTYISSSLIVNGDVHIILRNGGKLKVNTDKNKHGGLRVEEGNSLAIYGQSQDEATMGELYAYGGKYSSAIGSGSDDGITCGAITINGGKVTAEGGDYGAGIGGGKYGIGQHITINGGAVTATGGSKGAGIGGGEQANGLVININGGTVTATGGEYAAGIGGGDKGKEYGELANGRALTIRGGTVTAMGGNKGAGIGGGCRGNGTDIKISGGVVTATGENAAGIGGGRPGSGSGVGDGADGGVGAYISISGGTVTATGDGDGAGIGSGGENDYHSINAQGITISGGKVTATGGENGAGIGGGKKSGATDITISGGTVIATKGSKAKDGIGSGNGGDASTNIKITGGSVKTTISTCQPINGSGAPVYKTPVTNVEGSPAELTGLSNYRVNDLYPENGTLYFWLPSGSYTFYSATRKYSGNAGSTITGKTFYGVSVNATDISALSGNGWTFDEASHTLTLSSARDYNLSGTDKVGNIRVKVTASGAHVTLTNLTMAHTTDGTVINFMPNVTNATLQLVGENVIHGQGTYAAISINSGAAITLSGDGSLEGDGANSRGFVINGGTLVMESGTISDYSVAYSGGGVDCASGTFTMNGGTIRNCSAAGTGGGAVRNVGTFTMNGGTISGCSAGSSGGAIYNAGTLAVYGGTISGCSASSGGALCNDGTANIYGGTFTGSSASTGYGGFCYCNKDRAVSIYGGYFSGNTAPSDGCNLFACYDLDKNGKLYGGVFAADPLSDAESRGCLVLQSIEQGTVAVTSVGNFYVVGTDVKSQNGKLTSGTYTFNPGNLEYENAGLKVLDNCTVTEQPTTPKTYLVKNFDDFRVNGVAIGEGSGTGWTFNKETGLLGIQYDSDYVLSGACDDNVQLKVYVNAKANITLSDVRIHSGRPGQAVFEIRYADTTLTLGGSNEVYTTGGNAAFDIVNGASLTMGGTGALWGGKDVGANCRCVSVASDGAFTMTSGEIHGYSATTDGSVILNSGKATIYGGTIADNGGTALLTGTAGTLAVYGGAFTDNGSAAIASGTGTVYGGVYDVAPATSFVVSGSAATKVGDFYVVGQGVTEVDGQLTGGTYTFNPQAAEYAAAGITCAAHYPAVPQGTTPETYTVHAEAEFKVNGVSVETGSGEGWSFETEGTAGRLTLSKPMDYTLTGYADLTLTVDVLSNATVSLSGIRIRADKPSRDIFRVFGDDTTFVLSGTNTVYANDGNAAIGVTAGARLKVEGCRLNGGDGDCLVGGRTSGVKGRALCVNGELVLESGAIRDYYSNGGGGAILNWGTFEMDGGMITDCLDVNWGGAIYNAGTLTINGGAINGCSSRSGGALFNDGTVNIYGGTFTDNGASGYGGFCYDNKGKGVSFYGGYFSGNTAPSGHCDIYHGYKWQATGRLYGGVFAADPLSDAASKLYLVLQGNAQQVEVGDLWVVGTDVSGADNTLSYGTYTFDPQEDEYAAVGLGIAERHIVTAQGTTPETYFLDWNYTGLKIGYQDSYGNIVDAKDIIVGSGNGWSFDEASGIVTINAVRHEEYDDVPHVLMGQNTRKDIDLGVSVTANGACVMFTNATIATTAKAALAVNDAANVTLLMAGESTLTAKYGYPAILCPADTSVTLQLADGYAAADSAKLTVSGIGGAGSVSLGGASYWYDEKCGTIEVTEDIDVGTLAIKSGILNVAGDVTGDTIAINGGRTTAAGDITGATVTIEGGTIVADTIEATGEDASVVITGGSVKAGKVKNPVNDDGDTVWCVTVPEVTNTVDTISCNYTYGDDDIYPIGEEIYLWMPNCNGSDDPWVIEVANDDGWYESYYADVNDAPTVAYHEHDELALYVNGEQVTTEGGTGWTYEDIGDYTEDWVLTLTADGTNAYVITGEEMQGRVRIVVAGNCDMTFSGRLGGGNPDDYQADNLLVIGAGTTVNLTLASTAFFKPYTDYAPIAVQDGAVLNLVDAGTMSDLKIDFPGEGTGKVVMADPTSITFTTEESAKAAAQTIQPIANEADFPGIDQDAYATRVKAVAVESSTPGMWTLDYQINEKGTNDIVMVISSVETSSNLVENITLGTPTATIMPVPGFYYGLPGAVEVEDVEGASVPSWYAGQEGEPLEVKGSTFINADKAFYQLRATLKP